MEKETSFLDTVDPSIMERINSLDLSEVEREGLIRIYYEKETKNLSEIRERKMDEVKTQFPELESLGIFLFIKTRKSGKKDNSTFPYFELDSGEKVIPGSILQLFGEGYHGLTVKKLSSIYTELGINHKSLRIEKNGKSRKECGIVEFSDESIRKHPKFKEIKKSLKPVKS